MVSPNISTEHNNLFRHKERLPVSQFMKCCAVALAGLVLALSPTVAKAQNVKPVVVVSLASVEKQRADLLYLAELVGQKEAAEGMLNFAPIFLNGVDMKRPAGGYLTLSDGGEAKFVAFIPVLKLDTVLKTLEGQIGKPTDLGDGIKQIDPPNGGEPLYVKESKGWAFVSNDKASVASPPADPLVFLGNLPTMYNFAVRGNVHSIPAELRGMATSAIQDGLNRGLEQNRGSEEDRELAEKVGKMSAQQLQRLIEETNEVTIGWGVDKTLKATYVDFAITAVEGTAMARQMALLKDTTSNFAGFLLPTASVNLNGSTRMSPEEIEQNATLLQVFQDRANKEIDDDAGLDADQRTQAKAILKDLFGVLTDTVKGGKMDYGAALVLAEEKLSFAGGLLVSDGKKLEGVFAKLVELAKDEPDFPDVKLNAGKHGNVTLHTIDVDIPDGEEQAQQIFGEQLHVVIGTAPKAVYVAFGKDGESLMKQAIDASAQKGSQPMPPSQINIYLKPIVQFAASMDPSENPVLQKVAESMADAKGGTDEINLVTKPIPGGAVGRLQVNDGVLKLIGQAIKAAQDR
jgi:hypothetical protein